MIIEGYYAVSSLGLLATIFARPARLHCSSERVSKVPVIDHPFVIQTTVGPQRNFDPHAYQYRHLRVAVLIVTLS